MILAEESDQVIELCNLRTILKGKDVSYMCKVFSDSISLLKYPYLNIYLCVLYIFKKKLELYRIMCVK